MQQFRPPTQLRKPVIIETSNSLPDVDEPVRKKRKVSVERDLGNSLVSAPSSAKPRSTFVPQRQVLSIIQNGADSPSVITTTEQNPEGYYNVLWRKFSNKKHKKWDGDGILVVRGGYAALQDLDGTNLGRIACNRPLLSGSTLSVGGKDVEVDSLLSKADYLAGKSFSSVSPPKKVSAPKYTQPQRLKHRIKVNPPPEASSSSDVKIVAVRPSFKTPQFRTPLLVRPDSRAPDVSKGLPQPRHDPDVKDALVMKRPVSIPKGKHIVDVVVDPLICRYLRDHQRIGVQFLYECVMGLRMQEGEGAVLADEMGLGKTLQTIALLWTLLKQNPIYEDPPVVRKALIVCPATLINNWRKEIRKWLGLDRVGVFVADDKKARITDFTKGRAYSIMIVGYEKLRTIQDQLKKDDNIDIVIADEGHRLKTAQNKSAAAIRAFNTDRRIILTGTPIQNDLSEFWTMVDFVNPGLLSKYTTFKREFETPILKSRQPEATRKDIELGEGRSEELATLTSQFILRRTSDIIAKYLPPKTENILFCRPTTAQSKLYKAVITSPMFSGLLGVTEATLQLITILKQLCNSPSLLLKSATDRDKPNEAVASMLAGIDPALLKVGPVASAKLQVLDTLLHYLRKNTEEKVVIVSNYTSTLDILGSLLTSLSYPFVRLDGQTPVGKRQGIVDGFNKHPVHRSFAFLLSTKAGGVGINLIGASRLVLFDSDWNPAHDLQAMARIHRDGQKLPCYIYRFLVQGCLDEKIFQRQVTKSGLADAIVDAKKNAQGFTSEELRDLFKIDEGEQCPTHELLQCPCEGHGNAATDSGLEKAGFGTSMDDSAADDSVDDDDEPLVGRIVTADQVDDLNERMQTKRVAQKAVKRKEKMLTLMQYLHIDAVKIRKDDGDLDSLIEDQILLDVLKEEGSRVNFVFAKTTG